MPSDSDLAARHCVPCKGGSPKLGLQEIEALAPQVPGWRAVDGHHLERRFRFGDFAQALAFVNRVGALAEAEGHHPDIRLGWGYATLTLWTHKLDGLSEADFVLAAKIDRL